MPFTKSYSGRIEENYYGLFDSIEETRQYEWELPKDLQMMVYQQNPENAVSLHSEDRDYFMQRTFPRVPADKRYTFLALYRKRPNLFKGFPTVWNWYVWKALLLSVPSLEAYNEWKLLTGEEFPVTADISWEPPAFKSFWEIFISSEDADVRLVENYMIACVRQSIWKLKPPKSKEVREEIGRIALTNLDKYGKLILDRKFIFPILVKGDNHVNQHLINKLYEQYTDNSKETAILIKEIIDRTGLFPEYPEKDIKKVRIIPLLSRYTAKMTTPGVLLDVSVFEHRKRAIREYISSYPEEADKYTETLKEIDRLFLTIKNQSDGSDSERNVGALKALREIRPDLVRISEIVRNGPTRDTGNIYISFLPPDDYISQSEVRLSDNEVKFLDEHFKTAVQVSMLVHYKHFIGYLHPIDRGHYEDLFFQLREAERKRIEAERDARLQVANIPTPVIYSNVIYENGIAVGISDLVRFPGDPRPFWQGPGLPVQNNLHQIHSPASSAFPRQNISFPGQQGGFPGPRSPQRTMTAWNPAMGGYQGPQPVNSLPFPSAFPVPTVSAPVSFPVPTSPKSQGRF